MPFSLNSFRPLSILLTLSLTLFVFVFYPEILPAGISAMKEKSKILFIGGTGYIGKYIVEASATAGHPTFALVREATLSSPSKSAIIDSFKSHGVNFLIVRPINDRSFLAIELLVNLHFSFVIVFGCREKE